MLQKNERLEPAGYLLPGKAYTRLVLKAILGCVYFLITLFALRYTFPQSLYELKAQLGQQVAHAQTFDRGTE